MVAWFGTYVLKERIALVARGAMHVCVQSKQKQTLKGCTTTHRNQTNVTAVDGATRPRGLC